MRYTTWQSILFILLTLTLVACGEDRAPVALQTVTPDDPEEFSRLQGPLTLYKAVRAQGVPSRVAKVAFQKYDQFVDQVRNPGFIAMIDFTQHSGKRRFYLVNRKTGKVDSLSVAHGSGSDPDNDGIANYFSNVPDSHMSSLGSYLIQERYVGKYGASMRLDGLEETNSNVRDRAIVLHPSQYVNDGRAKQGRSWGCPAVPYGWIEYLIQRTRDGGFMYAYGINSVRALQELDLLRKWEAIPRHMWPDEGEDAPIEGE